MTPRFLLARRAFAAGIFGAALLAAGGPHIIAEQKNGVPSRPHDRTIQHVLNRITFGPRPGHLEQVLRAAMSDRQLQEVLVDFCFNHFNVFAGRGQVRDYLPSYERDVIRPHVFGTFRDMVGAVAHSPAMLFYLDNWQSASPDAKPP